MIRVYDDHVLITSPGTLPEGVTIEDLSRDPHPSKLRNPLLAQAFYFTEIVERWGSGTIRMLQACRAQNLPAPKFSQIGSELHVTFRKNRYNEEWLRAQGLSDRQIRAVRYVQEKGIISNAEYRSLTTISARTAANDLTDLVRRKIFSPPIGRGPSLRYKLAIAQIAQ
jgi:ATP-dependent DNA helicase RecG